MSTSNGNTSNPSLGAGRPATSGNGQLASFDLDELAAAAWCLHSAVELARFAVWRCVDVDGALGYGGGIGASEYFRTPEGARRWDRLNWNHVEIVLDAAGARLHVCASELPYTDDRLKPEIDGLQEAVWSVVSPMQLVIESFEYQAAKLSSRTVVRLNYWLEDLEKKTEDLTNRVEEFCAHARAAGPRQGESLQ